MFNLKSSQVLSSRDLIVPTSAQQFQCDCACEGGLSKQTSTTLSAVQIDEHSQPTPFPQLYRYELNQNELNQTLCLYNAESDAGVTVLNEVAGRVFAEFDGQRNLNQVYTRLLEADPAADFQDLVNLVATFERQALIYLGSQKPMPHIEPSRKLGIWLHVTNQCNLRCTYCYLGKTSEVMTPELGRKVLDSLLESALQQGMREISLKFAGGEALLEWPLVEELYYYALEKTRGTELVIQPIILSNGTPLTPEKARLLKQHGFQVAISLDGLGAVNDKQRPFVNGRGSFEKVERGLRLLQEYEIPFNVSVVVTAQNLEQLPQLFEYLLAHKAPFNLNFFRDNPLANDGLVVDNPELIAGLLRAYAMIETDLPNYSLMGAILDRVQLDAPHRHACGAGVNYVVVKHTGEIASCQMLMHRPAGKIGEGDPLKIIRGGELRNVPTEQKKGCADCKWRYVCAGGCPLVTHRAFGRYDTRSPYCDTYMTLIPEVLRLEALRILKYAPTLVAV